jgi:hypothetical protein
MTRAAEGRVKEGVVGAEFNELDKAVWMLNIIICFCSIHEYLLIITRPCAGLLQPKKQM